MDYSGGAGHLATTGLGSGALIWGTTGSLMVAIGVVLVTAAAVATRLFFRRDTQATDPS